MPRQTSRHTKAASPFALLDSLIAEQAAARLQPDDITIADYNAGLIAAGLRPLSDTTITRRLDRDKRLARVAGFVYDARGRRVVAWRAK